MADGKPRIAFIGFGEAGQAIAAGLRDAEAAQMAAWDILFPQAAGGKLRRAADAGRVVHCAASAADAVRQAELVISAVTAASSGEAAESVKAHLRGKPFFLDINSVSPGRKQDTANCSEALHATLTSPYWRRSTRRAIRRRCLLPDPTAKPSRRRLLTSACAQVLPAPRLARRRRSRWCAA